MKAIKAIDKKPVLIDAPEPKGEGVKVKVVSSSICGSDIDLMAMGAFGEHIIGHEFAGVTEDGRAVAIEPIGGCGQCLSCEDGHRIHCEAGLKMMGVLGDGGMAEYVRVPEANLVVLPTGLDIRIASLVEPLAVAVHGIDRARVRVAERVLVIGAGPIGLAAAAVLRARGIAFEIMARHDHQKAAAARLGAGFKTEGHFDVVIDAVGGSASLQQAGERVKPMGRIGLLGMSWSGVNIEQAFFGKEPELISSIGYKCERPNRSFDEAGKILHRYEDVAQALVTHRFPLDAASEAFATAANRAEGAIKVVFDVC